MMTEPKRVQSLRVLFVTVLIATLGCVAQARPAATPDSVFEKCVTSIERQIASVETRLESQLNKADATIQRLIDRDAPEAQIIKAVNSAATGLAKTVRSAASGMIKTANASRKTLVKMQAAAQRKGDDDTASEAEAYIEELDSFVSDVSEEANSAIESLASYRQQLIDADDFESAFEEVSAAIVSDIEEFIASFDDDDDSDE